MPGSETWPRSWPMLRTAELKSLGRVMMVLGKILAYVKFHQVWLDKVGFYKGTFRAQNRYDRTFSQFFGTF